LEFQKCLVSLNSVRRHAWKVANDSENDKVRIQALALVRDCTSATLDALTNAGAVDFAVSFMEKAAVSKTSSGSVQTTTTAKTDKRQVISEPVKHVKSGGESTNDIQRTEQKNKGICADGTAPTTNKVF
jgi:hypothetical protein